MTLLASQPSLISTKLARIFPVLSSTTFLRFLFSPLFFDKKRGGGRKNAVITCKVHVAEAYSRPHRSVCVPSDFVIRNTAHRPFKVRTLCLSPPLGFFSPSPLPLTSLFTSLLFCPPPPPFPLRSTCPALPLSSIPPTTPPPPPLQDCAETEVDRNKCCTLCNMFFTSAIVAQSHYQGKTHAKRVRLVLGEPPSIPAAMTSPTNAGTSSPTSPAALTSPQQPPKHD